MNDEPINELNGNNDTMAVLKREEGNGEKRKRINKKIMKT